MTEAPKGPLVPRTLGLSRQALDRLQEIAKRIELGASREYRRELGLDGWGEIGYADLVRLAVDRFLAQTGDGLPPFLLQPVGKRGEPAKLTAARERYAKTQKKAPRRRKRGAR